MIELSTNSFRSRFGAQKTLQYLASLNNRRDRKPQLGSVTTLLLCLDVLREKAAAKRAGKREIGRVWLTHRTSVNRASHGVNQVPDQQAFKFVAAVNRQHQLSSIA